MDTDRVVGSQVAGYTIESVLGRGGMGVVYLARQRSPDRRLALKLITPAYADDDSFRQSFLREATAAAAIDHPHVLPVYDAGEVGGVLFIAMRLVDGEDLRAILRAPGPLDLERVVAIVGQVGDALDAAHARGLVHRDVKPGNILVAAKAEPDDPDFCYLTDFGVSGWTTSSAGTVTSTDHMVGSLNYAAPEQIEGKGVHASADRYSLGCVVYECLTGRAPFAGRSPAATLYAQLHEEPAPPSSLRPGLPSAVDVVVERTLRKAAEDRYSSCRGLTLDLRAALAGGSPTSARPADRSAPRSRPRSRWIAAAVLVGLLVVALAGIGLADRFGGGPAVAPPSGSPAGSPEPERISEGVQVTTTSQTAPPSKDAAGNVVTYLPSNVLDGDVATAWRTSGNGHGDTLTLLFDGPVDIVRVGLIPGYAKSDPETGTNRFLQDRIIKKVRYLIPDLPPTVQRLLPDPSPQDVPVSATTSQITVEILNTTKPGGANYTAISEIYVYGYPQ
jgi:serine/threonine-protein kinase